MATLGVLQDPKKLTHRRTSCETLCSSNSSCVLQKRKPIHPLANIQRKSSNSSVTQRVLSAKVLRFKTLQNQLNDANYHITQLINENRSLKTLQKRQDNALSRYEGANAELPQVLESHHEEIRVVQARNKNLRKNARELMEQIKLKDEELNNLRDQNKHLVALCKNKNLDEREKLAEKVQDLEERVRQSEGTISTLNRKMMLESKNSKYKLNAEIMKHKQTQKELDRALSELEHYSSLLEGKGKLNLVKSRKSSTERKSTAQSKSDSGSSIKLLSADTKMQNCISSLSTTNFSEDVESFSSSSSKTNIDENHKKSATPPKEVDMSSEAQLKEIVNNWQKKNSDKTDPIEKGLNEYCSTVLTSAKECTDIVEKHNEEFKQSMKETESLLQVLKENDTLNEKLHKLNVSGDILEYSELSKITQNGTNKLIDDRKVYNFNEKNLINNNKNGNSEVGFEEKKKLLAALRAIDNGENVETSNGKRSKSDLMRELFG